MHRRHLILSMGATVLASAFSLPLRVAATPVTGNSVPVATIDMLRQIDSAIDTAAFYCFDFQQTEKLLGVVTVLGKSDIMNLRFALQHLVLDIGHRDTIDRVRYINAIRAHLNAKYGSEYKSAHILWMHRTGPVWNSSARSLMETGKLADLRAVATWLDPTIT